MFLWGAALLGSTMLHALASAIAGGAAVVAVAGHVHAGVILAITIEVVAIVIAIVVPVAGLALNSAVATD